MAYTFPFNAAQIPGSTQAKLIDDTFRSMHSALIERLNDKIVVSAIADPWVLKPEVSGAKNNKVLRIPFINFVPLGGGTNIININNVSCDGPANALVAGFSLPVGVTITGVIVNILNTGSANLELYKVSGASPFAKSSIAAWSQAPAGLIASSNNTTLTEVTDDFATYCISADLASSAGGQLMSIYGARVIYNTPSHLNTI